MKILICLFFLSLISSSCLRTTYKKGVRVPENGFGKFFPTQDTVLIDETNLLDFSALYVSDSMIEVGKYYKRQHYFRFFPNGKVAFWMTDINNEPIKGLKDFKSKDGDITSISNCFAGKYVIENGVIHIETCIPAGDGIYFLRYDNGKITNDGFELTERRDTALISFFRQSKEKISQSFIKIRVGKMKVDKKLWFTSQD